MRSYVKQYITVIRQRMRKMAQSAKTDSHDNKENMVPAIMSAAGDPKLLPQGIRLAISATSEASEEVQRSHQARFHLLDGYSAVLTSESQPFPMLNIPSTDMHSNTVMNTASTATCIQMDTDGDVSSELSSCSLTVLRGLLEEAQPPLGHLLPSLIKIGFKNDQVLKGVLTWPTYELLDAMDKWHSAGYLTAATMLERNALRIQLVAKQRPLE